MGAFKAPAAVPQTPSLNKAQNFPLPWLQAVGVSPISVIAVSPSPSRPRSIGGSAAVRASPRIGAGKAH